jgi:hypothetical protein
VVLTACHGGRAHLQLLFDGLHLSATLVTLTVKLRAMTAAAAAAAAAAAGNPKP